jgi:alkylation response protein AidB-like acyl-CoA dehydrogenase
VAEERAARESEERGELVALARAEGLLTPQAPTELGGMGFDHATQAVNPQQQMVAQQICFEGAGAFVRHGFWIDADALFEEFHGQV